MSEKWGISIVYQGLSLASHLTVEENIILGSEICIGGKWGVVNHREQKRRVREYLDIIGVDISPDDFINRLNH